MEMLRVVTHAGAILVRVNEAGVQSVAVPGLEVPTDRNGQFWVHFNKHDPARYVSAKDVLAGHACRRTGCAAGSSCIGTSATGLLDLKTTPLDPAMPGVEVHAQILESVLTKSLLVQPELCHRRRTRGRGAARDRHHRRRADAVGERQSCCSARS